MGYTIEESDIFDDSFRRTSLSLSALALSLRLVEFIRWKQGGGNGPDGPFSNDKASGRRPDGTVFEPYVSLGLRHCHLDLVGTEPLLAYRQFEGEKRVLLLCLTNHTEMFTGHERAFVRKVRGIRRGRSLIG